MTPALCIGSMFCGRVASSATVCTKVTRSFWYFSNTCSTARVDAMVSETDEVVCLRASSDAACVPLWHARGTQVTEVDDASNADSLPLLEQGQKSQCEKIVWYF